MKQIFQIFLMFMHKTKTCILLHYYQGFCAHVFLFWHVLNQGSRRKASVAGLSCNHTNHTLLDLRQRLVLGLRIAAKLIHQEKSRYIQFIKISLPIKLNSEPIGFRALKLPFSLKVRTLCFQAMHSLWCNSVGCTLSATVMVYSPSQ